MKIAFDLRRIENPGIGRYMKGLAEAVISSAPQHDYLLILPDGFNDGVFPDRIGVQKISSLAKCYSIREQAEIPGIVYREKVDLLHSPHFNVPLLCPCRIVATIHDVIYLACSQDLASVSGKLYYRAMLSAAVRRANQVITVSEFSKQDILEHLKVASEKVQVIYPGVDAGFHIVSEDRIRAVRLRYGVTGDYILYAGIFKSRKNHAALIRSFRIFLDSGAGGQLVFAGPCDQSVAELQRLACDLGLAEKLVFTGFVSESDLPALYSGARVYACSSLYEGFGFTVLEAMACGVPVVCSNSTSLPEVAGHAALYADPHSGHDFARALLLAFRDDPLRAALIERGLENVKRFQWSSAAASVVGVYESMVKHPVAGRALA